MAYVGDTLARFLVRHMDAGLQHGGSQSAVPGPAPSASPGKFLEIQGLGPDQTCCSAHSGWDPVVSA